MTITPQENTSAGEVVLTAHPLQRIGAYALAALAEVDSPSAITHDGLRCAVDWMTEDAISAALEKDSNASQNFWLKCSLSFFPNSPMNHPSNGKKSGPVIEDGIRNWRSKPSLAPGVPCVLCGRPAAGFYGKVDVPLAESNLYRNTTPRGHQGMALCWPCVCCFHALPYGCQLTGGPARAVHSWDEEFLAWTVRRQCERNRREIVVDRSVPRQPPSAEVVALKALKAYDDDLKAGVELMVFSNNNRGQTLEVHALDQPLAEWLRKSIRLPQRKAGMAAMLRAHRTPNQSGVVGLARNVFRDPTGVINTVGRYLGDRAAAGVLPESTGPLVALCLSFVGEVMGMDQKVLAEITATANRVGELLSQRSAGEFNKFRAAFRKSVLLRSWLRREAVHWVLLPGRSAERATEPLVSPRAYELLFDPGMDSQAWFHRELFFFAVLAKLHELGWRPADAAQVAKELAEEDDTPEDREFLDGEE